MGWLISKKPEDKSLLERFPFWIGTVIGSLFIVFVFLVALADINRSVSHNNAFYELFSLDSMMGSRVRYPNKMQVIANMAPQITILSPVRGASVSGKIAVTVGVGRQTQVSFIRLFIDGRDAGVMTAPYTTAWDTALLANGPHTLRVVAADMMGNEASVSVEVVVAN